MKKRKTRWRNVKIKFILLSLVLILVFFGYKSYNDVMVHSEQNKIINDETKVLDTITQMIEINTIKYHYSNIIDIQKDKRINDIKLPFTEKYFVVRYEGIINGGINMNDVEVEIVGDKEVYINIKNVGIKDHFIKDESVYVYDSSETIFNKIEIQEVFDDISNYKVEYERKVISEGFLDEVKKSVENELKVLVRAFGYDVVKINFL
ncbi:MAG: DUF4230 domain-containing protein [Peptostreptococcaceae bacterium]